MGFENSVCPQTSFSPSSNKNIIPFSCEQSHGVEQLYTVLSKQFALTQERYLALCIVDILVVVSVRDDCSRRTCWEIAGLLQQYLCTIYSNTKEPLVLPTDIPRKNAVPLPLPKPPNFQGMWSYHYVIRAMLSLLGQFQSFAVIDSILTALESFDPLTGFFEQREGCVEHPKFVSMNWRSYPSVCHIFSSSLLFLTFSLFNSSLWSVHMRWQCWQYMTQSTDGAQFHCRL